MQFSYPISPLMRAQAISINLQSKKHSQFPSVSTWSPSPGNKLQKFQVRLKASRALLIKSLQALQIHPAPQTQRYICWTSIFQAHLPPKLRNACHWFHLQMGNVETKVLLYLLCAVWPVTHVCGPSSLRRSYSSDFRLSLVLIAPFRQKQVFY